MKIVQTIVRLLIVFLWRHHLILILGGLSSTANDYDYFDDFIPDSYLSGAGGGGGNNVFFDPQIADVFRGSAPGGCHTYIQIWN